MLNGKERVQLAMKCREVDRIPWIPFVGCHAGALLDCSAEEFLKNADKIVEGVNKAVGLYHPDGIPVVFDLQIEAETFGCDLKWAEDNPPSVISHPLLEGKTLSDLSIPGPTDGRIGMVLDATRRLREAHPDIALYGLITGPFTLALHLLGTDIFMRMFDATDELAQTFTFCQQVCEKMASYYIEAGCDVIAIVDPMTSQIGPDQFREFVTPYISPVFELIRAQGALGSFFVCGHAQQNIKAMCACKPDNISIDENIALDYVKEIALEHGISFGGNLQLTSILLLGSPEDARHHAIDCLEIGGECGYLLAPGCDLPFATPPENLQAVAEMVLDPYQREVVKARGKQTSSENLLDMREYGQSNRVIVDIITLDSEGCTPCQYMVESVRNIAPEFEGIVEWREHKIKYKESLIFMTSLMVKNIPTICIDGQIKFVSRIPHRDELKAAIQERIFEKMRVSIKRRKAALYVLGNGDEACQQVEENTRKAIMELGTDVEVEVITDEKEIYSYGVLPTQTPAVVLAQYQLKSTCTPPEVKIIKEWLKAIR